MTRVDPSAETKSKESIAHLKDFRVIEFRRYGIKEGEREHFARYFESFFPEAFQQIGAFAFGQFFERNDPTRFTWMRGFQDMDARATANAAFYYGPLWKEHRASLNDRMLDFDNVLLLRPLSPERGITILPAVDPVKEPDGARGIVAAQVFPLQANCVDAFAQEAEKTFAGYRAAGVREAGVLVSLDAPNNFPQHPIRTDGPFLIWLGIVRDDATLETRFAPLAASFEQSLSSTGLLRGAPELIVLDPTSRSRLRWLP